MCGILGVLCTGERAADRKRAGGLAILDGAPRRD
jgi:hypothetical protein